MKAIHDHPILNMFLEILLTVLVYNILWYLLLCIMEEGGNVLFNDALNTF